MMSTRVIETRRAHHPVAHFAAHGFDPAHQPRRRVGLGLIVSGHRHRHEIADFRHPLRGQETRQENVRIDDVKLLVPRIVEHRRDLEMTALFIVEQRGEYRRRIEVRETQVIDGAVHAHHRHRLEVADDAVVFDGLIITHIRVSLRMEFPRSDRNLRTNILTGPARPPLPPRTTAAATSAAAGKVDGPDIRRVHDESSQCRRDDGRRQAPQTAPPER